MNLKIGIFLIALISASLLIGCTTQAPAPSPPATATPYPGSKVSVEIKSYAFTPQTIIVNKGTNVTWTNRDSAPHTIKSQGNFESPVLQNGDSWSYSFNSTGNFDYICGLHPSMTGKITVQ